MLEELGEPYELEFVDMMKGEHREAEHGQRNRMFKLPTLADGDANISETAAIGVYLADRYALGRLAPRLEDPERGAYLRWCFFAPSVLEMACMAKSSGWEYSPGRAGFGTYEDAVATLDEAVATGPWLLGERFTMADVVVGGTTRWMLRFGMLEGTAAIHAYAERLGQRGANQRAARINADIVEARGISRG